jgi:glycerol uptake facilitator protein
MNGLAGEFFGTMILIVLGNGVVAGVVLNRTKAQNAGWIVVTTGWALAVMAGIFTAKAAGGPGYINPVGPLADLVAGKLAAEPALRLVAAELLGAIAGAVLVWLHYLPHWAETPDPDAKRACFCTSPAVRHPAANLFSEAFGTFVLVFVGAAIAKEFAGAFPVGAALVWAIGLSLGATTGYAINPARDLGPRLAHAFLPIAGKGTSDWGYAWVPVVGPCLGAVAGVLLAGRVLAG